MDRPDPQHRRAVLLLSFAAFASAASARLCDPMLPSLVQVFRVAPEQAAQVVSSFSVAYGLLQVFFGPLGDRIGKYRLIALTTLACTVGSLGAVLAQSMGWLIVARLLTGASAAGIIPLSMAWIGDTISYEHRQATLARFLAGQIVGVIGGQFIGGVFTDTLGFRWAFGFMAATYLVVGLWVLYESHANERTHHVRHAATGPAGVLSQARVVLGVSWARAILATVFVEGLVVFGTLAFVPSYLHGRFGLSLTLAGALMAAFGIGGFSYTLFARQFVSGLGEVGLAKLGGVLIGTAWFMLAAGPAWGWALPACYLVGLGYYMLHNTLQTNATQMAPQVRGTAVSLFASAFFLGQSLGVVLASFLLAWSGPALLFTLAGLALPVIGLVFSRALKRHHIR
ncbi:MAG: MFS transporter [Betaproteobacteria bacterium]|nr:MFS transporter [Betaproteobacteria bacterium]